MSPFLSFALGAITVGILIPLVGSVRRRVLKRRSTATFEDNKVTTVSQVLHLTIQSSPTAVAVLDRTGSVIMSNGRAHDMAIVHDRTVNPEIWREAQEVYADREPRTLDMAIPRRRTGNRVTNVRALITPLTLNDDRFVVVYGTDESEKVRMENARRDFVANVSHELKTPVSSMSLLAEALLGSPDDVETVNYFGRKILSESHRMAEMITELISLSKLQGAEALPEMSPVSVDDVISEAITRNQLAADNVGIELLQGKQLGVQVMGEKNLLVTAVTNLITNAINYSPKAMPVSITQKVVGDVINIRVTDRGLGISPEDQKRVFERFYRVDKARSRATGGTGLGLAIVKHVVANHGGNIKLWSRPGTGSTFTIELPIYHPEQQEETEPQQPAQAQPLLKAVSRVTARRKDKTA